jgi:DNA-binding CsgD family transcriptional regulator
MYVDVDIPGTADRVRRSAANMKWVKKMLQHLSTTMSSLYALAQDAEPERFRCELLEIVRSLIRFDGAVLEARHINLTARHDCDAAREPLIDRVATILSHLELPHYHVATAAFFAALTKPEIVNRPSDLEQHALPCLRELAAADKVLKLLLYGDVMPPQYIPRWLILYRTGEDDFTEADAGLLRACWPHIVQALEINLRSALNQVDPQHAKRALALINSCGVIEAADACLLQLLRTEWPDFNECSLPSSVLTALLETGVYLGKYVELNAFLKFGYLACAAKPLPIVTMLSPSEMNAAQWFASGMTHSEIAGRLGVSRHTIRNQLANAYQKLGIHSRTELIRVLSNS